MKKHIQQLIIDYDLIMQNSSRTSALAAERHDFTKALHYYREFEMYASVVEDLQAVLNNQ